MWDFLGIFIYKVSVMVVVGSVEIFYFVDVMGCFICDVIV